MSKGNDKSDNEAVLPTPEQWREICIVLSAGAVGGFASWAYGWIFNSPVPGGFWSLPLSMFFGAFAAGAGVYVLANSNTAAFGRLLFFAALCGFSWKPVMDAGSAFVNQTIEQNIRKQFDEDVAERVENLAELAGPLAEASPEVVAREFPSLSAELADGLELLTDVSGKQAQRQVQSNLNIVARSLTAAAPKSPVVAASELQKISLIAEANGVQSVSLTTASALNALATTNPEINKVRNAVVATNVFRPRPMIEKPRLRMIPR